MPCPEDRLAAGGEAASPSVPNLPRSVLLEGVHRELDALRAHLLLAGYAPRTARIYVTHLRRLATAIGRPPAECAPETLRGFLDRLAGEGSPAAFSQMRSALRLHFGEVLGMPLLAAVVEERPGSGRPRDLPASEEERRRLRAAARTSRERLFLALIGELGLRPAQVVELRVRDVDLRNLRLRLTGRCGHLEGARSWPASLHADFANEMRGRYPHDWLFPGRGRGPLGIRTVQKVLRDLSRRAGLEPAITAGRLRADGSEDQ